MVNNMTNFESSIPSSHAVPNGGLNPNEAEPTKTVEIDGEMRKVFFTPPEQHAASIAVEASIDK